MRTSKRFLERGVETVAISLMATLITTLAAGCAAERHEPQQAPAFGPAESLEHFTPVGSAPMFAALPDGREVIAWVSAPDSSSNGRLYISVGGAPPTEITDSLGAIEIHSEAPPKIAVSADGTMHAIYVVGKEVPGRRFPLSALRYVQSVDSGKSFTSARTITDDDVFGSHNFHGLTAGDSGRVAISWLDGRHGSSSAYVAVSRDNGTSWSSNVRVDTTAACPARRCGLLAAIACATERLGRHRARRVG